jgi:amidase
MRQVAKRIWDLCVLTGVRIESWLPFGAARRSLSAPAESFSATVTARLASHTAAATGSRSRSARRVAFSPDLGVPPVESEVVALCRAAAGWWGRQGAELVEAAPDLQDMQQVFLVSE